MGRLVRSYKTEGENLHWHLRGLKKGMGTVEVTYTPSVGTISVLVHDNRQGFWAGQAYLRLSREILRSVKDTQCCNALNCEIDWRGSKTMTR